MKLISINDDLSSTWKIDNREISWIVEALKSEYCRNETLSTNGIYLAGSKKTTAGSSQLYREDLEEFIMNFEQVMRY